MGDKTWFQFYKDHSDYSKKYNEGKIEGKKKLIRRFLQQLRERGGSDQGCSYGEVKTGTRLKTLK